MTYARGTTVSTEQTRTEIERTIDRYGAAGFSYGRSDTRVIIQFEAHQRVVRFTLPLPAIDDPLVCKRRRGKHSEIVPHAQRAKRRDQIIRERWRALHLAIKAKLETVESGIAQFEEEFFAHIVDPVSQRTVYELVSPSIEIAYSANPKPIGLPAPPRPADPNDEEYVQ